LLAVKFHHWRQGGSHDTAGRLLDEYQRHCTERGWPFQRDLSVRPYDDSTLFCIAGMQQFKTLFSDPGITGTRGNVQSCLRVDDLEEIGDGTHCLYFNMLGLFSFRQLTVQQAIDCWRGYLERIGVTPDYVTVHPDRSQWRRFYPDLEVRLDKDCTWSDGTQTGYCTEFFVGDVEIGNIVNPRGDCIDVGFGLERLSLVLGEPPPTREQVLQETVSKLLESGYRPGNKRQGYVLRRLLRLMVSEGVPLDHPSWHQEVERQRRTLERYRRLKRRHSEEPPEWWWDTHGIDLEWCRKHLDK
jgi:alanyl-tRNA synthetase